MGADEPRTRGMQFSLLRAEMRKLLTLPVAWVAAAFAIALPPLVSWSNGHAIRAAIETGQMGNLVTVSTTDAGFNELMLGIIGGIVVGVVTATSEYKVDRSDLGSPQIFTSLVACPDRPRLLRAKASTVAVVVAVFASCSIPVTLGSSQWALGGYAIGAGPSLVWRGLGVALYWLLYSEIALAIAVVVRSGVAALVVLVANATAISLSFLLSRFTSLAVFLPDLAGSSLFLTERHVDGAPGPALGALIMATWMVGLLLVAEAVLVRRDA